MSNFDIILSGSKIATMNHINMAPAFIHTIHISFLLAGGGTATNNHKHAAHLFGDGMNS
jgi:hypothetical protein